MTIFQIDAKHDSISRIGVIRGKKTSYLYPKLSFVWKQEIYNWFVETGIRLPVTMVKTKNTRANIVKIKFYSESDYLIFKMRWI